MTTHNTHNRQTSMSPVGFEPTISAGERLQTYALDARPPGPAHWLLRSQIIKNVTQRKTESKGLSQQNTTCPALLFGRIPVGRVTDHQQGPADLLSNSRVSSGKSTPCLQCVTTATSNVHSCSSFMTTFPSYWTLKVIKGQKYRLSTNLHTFN